MKKVTRYETIDGKLFDTSEEAEKHERVIEAKKRVTFLIEENVPYSDNQKYVIDFIAENKEELRDLLNIILES